MQVETLLMKTWLLQRQALSVAAQPPRLALAKHGAAQAGSPKDGSIKFIEPTSLAR